jgi:hypothetical protein
MSSDLTTRFANRLRVCGALAVALHGACLLAQTPQPQALRPETIRGRVTNDSGRVLPAVTVIATMAPDRTFLQSVTDSTGRYEIHFDRGTGDYLIYAGPVGYRAFRRRVTLPPNNATLVVDIRLTADATLLAAVRVSATKPRPIPDGAFTRDPTAPENRTGGVNGMVSPDQLGDLNALAATIPGIGVASDGRLVAFGMPGQISTTYNGMSMVGSEMPRDTRMQVSVLTSAYDPSIGGFGGARINVTMAQGGRVHEAFGRMSLDAPALQYTDPVAERLGQRFAQGVVSALADGPIGEHNAWYNTGFQGRRYSSDARSLLDAQRDVLTLAGVSPDSVARLRQIAGAQGIPLIAGGIPSARINQGASFVGRVDAYRDPMRYRVLWKNAFNFTTLASISTSDTPGSGPTTAPAFGRSSTTASGQGIAQYMRSGEVWSAEVMSTLGGSRSWSNPYLDLPTARVRVLSQLDPADPVTGSLAIGGNPSSSATTSGGLWETVGYVHFYAGNAHKMKLYGRSKFDEVTTGSASSFGAFAYNSLGDLESNRPASFTRTFAGPARSASSWLGAFSVGDLWQISPTFQLQPGVRFEANRFLTTPVENPAIATAFGVSNTNMPNTFRASPRLGFAWTYRQDRITQPYGSNAVGRILLPPLGVLSGGIGEFRNDLSAGSALGPISSTGLPDGAQQITCIGAAVPTPDWRGYARDPSTVPTQCAGGAAPVFSDAKPNVLLFDPSYALAHSWRANLRWAGSYRQRVPYSVDAAYSYNANQPGIRDLNFSDAPRFSLDDEGGRPVFALPGSIVPATGIVATTDARHSAAFGRVSEIVSDLRSTARQITLAVAPVIDRTLVSVSYTLGDVRASARGFDAATYGSPLALESARSPSDVRHNVAVMLGRQLGSIGASLFWRLSSGAPYTPTVGSDINGDGYANDRAFVFDPAHVADGSVSNGLRSLLASAPRQARDCLLRQMGHPAARNGCEGPWTATMNAALSTNYFRPLGNRLFTASLNFANPLAGLDQALHGGDHLHGWGTPAYPDPVLYTVRGFDPSTNRFQYVVNPRFGSTRPSETTIRSPFRVTLDVRIELGTSSREQQFKRFLEVSAVTQNHAPAPVDSLRSRLSEQVGSYYQYFIRLRDSLLLTRKQVEVYEAADSVYQTKADAVWQELALHILAQRDHPDLHDIGDRLDAAAAQVWAIQREEIPRLRAGLTPAQLELADFLLRGLVESRERPPPRRFLF